MESSARPLDRPRARIGAATGLAAALLLVAAPATAQDAPGCFLARGTPAEAAERPSPLDSATVRLGGGEAKICYGAPSARGRTVMGELVPFDAPWRAGANEATALHLAFPAEVAGIRLDPGSYSLYTIPGAERWEIVLNATAERWGVPIDDAVRSSDVGSAEVPAESTEDTVETLDFRFETVGENEAHLIMEWENTRVRIPVQRLES